MMEINKRDKLIELYEKYSSFLTQSQSQAFKLYYFEDLSLKEVADVIAITRSGAYDAIKKAEKKLINIDKKINTKI